MDARPTPTEKPSSQAKPAAAKVDEAPLRPDLAPPRGPRRRLLFAILGAAVVFGALVYGLFWLLVLSHHETTDDAYVQADVADITALVSGPVVAAPAEDTAPVKKGDVLVVIDPADYQLALSQAEASLGQAERKVQGYFANRDADAAVTAARQADIERARAELASTNADLARAQTDLSRREALAPAGAVSGDELTTAQDRFAQARAAVTGAQAALTTAQANKASAEGQQRAAEVLIENADVASNPEVAVARAKVNQAKLDLDRTVIRAPFDGVVAKKTVEIGQHVQAGTELMNVAPIQRAYVDANFKEVQLKHVRPGQPVILTSDLYGGGVKFHGKVVGLSGGTGSAFALIPAQNATGNWIKVVQRVPVRISLDPSELKDHPLRVGLSMTADIDTAR